MSAPVVFLQGHSLVCIPIFLYRYLSYCIGAYLITLLQIDHSFFQFVTFPPPHTHSMQACVHGDDVSYLPQFSLCLIWDQISHGTCLWRLAEHLPVSVYPGLKLQLSTAASRFYLAAAIKLIFTQQVLHRRSHLASPPKWPHFKWGTGG